MSTVENYDGRDFVVERQCGKCDVCCTVNGVDEIDKPARTPCPFLAKKGGCGIYGHRPGECQRYYCGWILGHADRMDRPDTSGVLLDCRRDDKGFYLHAQEVFAGAFDTEKGKRALQHAAEHRRVEAMVMSNGD